MRFFVLFILFTSVGPHHLRAQTVTNETYCSSETAIRQTVVVIDGSIIKAEPNGPDIQNQPWRRFASQFVDSNNPVTLQQMMPRERVTLAVSSSDGSGISILFNGCVPVFSDEEMKGFDEKTTLIQTFFGNDWRSKAKDAAEQFARQARLSMVQGLTMAKIGKAERNEFLEGGLIRSLSKSRGFSLKNGLPRIVFFSDMNNYDLPVSDVVSARKKARSDADQSTLDLNRAEVHIFGSKSEITRSQEEYLKAFFLGNNGLLESINSSNGAIPKNSVPVKVDIYQGFAKFPNGDYPVRMRLAQDNNGSVLMSWVEVQSDRARLVPFEGLLSCDGATCKFVGDRIFAQIWSDNPSPEPECEAWMPFAGFRDLSFTIANGKIEGNVSDSGCYVEGQENGLTFKLQHVPNGIY